MNPEKPKSDVGQPASILVVDDTPANLQVLAGMLKDRGYKVRPVPSGKLALLAAGRDPPDLILLDINMPEMNGYEVCEHLKVDDQLKGIPVIFISALTEPLDKVKAFAIGGVDYLTKPFQMEELHARVETHLKLRRLQIELEEYSRRLELAQERLKLDLKLAREVQHGFLPLRVPEVPDYEFFAHYESAYEVGGDYYDFITLPANQETGGRNQEAGDRSSLTPDPCPLPPASCLLAPALPRQRLAVLLGDVAGKGVAAALLMAKLSADARFCILTESEPAAAVTKLNVLMIQSGIADRFVTLVVAVLDPESHTVTLVNAGHPSPLIYRHATRTVEDAISNDVAGFPIGVLDGFEYASCQIKLEPGDGLLAFTDGVTEAVDVNGVPLQTKGVIAALQGETYSPRALGERLVQAVKQFAAGRSQHDDLALVGFGRTS
jgi:serine phosphatase RsbU (regulator of sigma subunit)